MAGFVPLTAQSATTAHVGINIDTAALHPRHHTIASTWLFSSPVSTIAIHNGGILAIQNCILAHDDGDRHPHPIVAGHHHFTSYYFGALNRFYRRR